MMMAGRSKSLELGSCGLSDVCASAHVLIDQIFISWRDPCLALAEERIVAALEEFHDLRFVHRLEERVDTESLKGLLKQAGHEFRI